MPSIVDPPSDGKTDSPDEARKLAVAIMRTVRDCPDAPEIILADYVESALRVFAAEELRAMADVFDADAKHLVGGKAYAQAAEDCRDRAAALATAPRPDGDH